MTGLESSDMGLDVYLYRFAGCDTDALLELDKHDRTHSGISS